MRSLLYVLILSMTTFGCDAKKSPDSTATAERASNSKSPTSDDQPETNAEHHAADDKATEDLQAHRAEKAKAADVKADADADAVKAHAATQDQLQASFDRADRRFNPLKDDVGKLNGAKQRRANAAVTVVKTNEVAMMASIAKLRDASLADWDAAKARVDSDSQALDESIDALEKTMR